MIATECKGLSLMVQTNSGMSNEDVAALSKISKRIGVQCNKLITVARRVSTVSSAL